MSFAVAAEAYDRYMGRYAAPLAPALADFAQVDDCRHVLDVGCGPGALTGELVRRLGTASVSSVDPSEPFVAAARDRFPDVTVVQAAAEDLPFADGTFDAVLAQLVVHFLADPVSGIREMARVTRAGGTIAACVWDFTSDEGPVNVFWSAAHALDDGVEDESHLAGAREGHLAELFREAGLQHVEDATLEISVLHPTFEDWWDPFMLGVGPGGSYVASLEPAQVDRLREECRGRLPEAPFSLTARAWAARGRT